MYRIDSDGIYIMVFPYIYIYISRATVMPLLCLL